MHDDAGFTLIEALVALLILALASTALIAAAEAHIRYVDGLESRAAAQWVAENELAQLRLRKANFGNLDLAATMLDRRWRVAVDMKTTSDPMLAAVEIVVAEEGDAAPVVRFGGFLDVGNSAQ